MNNSKDDFFARANLALLVDVNYLDHQLLIDGAEASQLKCTIPISSDLTQQLPFTSLPLILALVGSIS